MQVEARLFDQDEGRLAEMRGILGIEDDVTGKTKMQLIKIIRKELDSKMESDEKTAQTYLEQLLACIKGTVPPLEKVGELSEEAEKNSTSHGKKQKNGRRGKDQK